MGHCQAQQAPASPSGPHVLVTSTSYSFSLPNDPATLIPKWLEPFSPPVTSSVDRGPINGMQSSGLSSSSAPAPRMAFWADVLVSTCVVFTVSFIPARLTLALSEGHVTHAKQLQVMGGLPPTFYWLIYFLWDIVRGLPGGVGCPAAATGHCPFWPLLGRDLSRMAEVKFQGLWDLVFCSPKCREVRMGYGAEGGSPHPCTLMGVTAMCYAA